MRRSGQRSAVERIAAEVAAYRQAGGPEDPSLRSTLRQLDRRLRRLSPEASEPDVLAAAISMHEERDAPVRALVRDLRRRFSLQQETAEPSVQGEPAGWPGPFDEPIRILFLGADPDPQRRVRVDQEFRAIQEALWSGDRHLFELGTHPAVSVGELQESLHRHRPHILHFSGHGEDDALLVDEGDVARRVPAAAFAALVAHFQAKGLCRVVLNACHTENQAQAIARAIDYVVGISRAIADRDAIVFATAFYLALAYDEERDVAKAFALACNRLALGQSSEREVPRLFCRSR
ncbi:MAG: CHAT domain-containing protein [bacterium]|nr:CHAT domain-containing protein [bacterium]